MKPVYNGHPWDHAEWLLNRSGLLIEHHWDHAKWLLYRGGLLIEVGRIVDFGTYPTGWHIEGDMPNQVAVSTDFTVVLC